MYGKGLIKGLSITITRFFQKKITQQYPEERPVLPERFRGTFNLIPSKCTACGLCANACPNNIIFIESIKDENNKRKLAKYTMTLGSCLYCGFCVEACPTKALISTTQYENTVYFRKDLEKVFINDEPKIPIGESQDVSNLEQEIQAVGGEEK